MSRRRFREALQKTLRVDFLRWRSARPRHAPHGPYNLQRNTLPQHCYTVEPKNDSAPARHDKRTHVELAPQ